MRARLGVVFVAVLVLSACARSVVLPDGTEMPADQYRAQTQEAHALAVAGQLASMIQDCSPDMTEKEASECRWSNAMTMVQMPHIAASMVSDGYWQKKAADRQFWLGVAQLAVNNPLTNALSQKWLYGTGGPGGYTEVNFGGRSAKGGKHEGMASASGDNDFEDLQVTIGNKSPIQTGDGMQAAGKDSQIQTGDGVQGQAVSRPTNQPQPNTSGGAGDDSPGAPINNNSEGLGFDGSL